MTMIERMARAMWETRRETARQSGIELEPWGDGTVPRANNVMQEARAALEAMRELDGEMMAALWEAMFKEPFMNEHVLVGAGIDAMIDAALAEEG